jgi:uncharacterized RmlC-like cupin family protein
MSTLHDTEAPAVFVPQTTPTPNAIVTVRPAVQTLSRQHLPYFVGISHTTAGAQGLAMHLVVIPPGGVATPHLHPGHETAIYVLKGQVETRYGEGLTQSVVNTVGDFLFIPPGLPHQPRNLSTTEAAYAIVARNDAREQEHVVPYDPGHALQ